MNPHDNPRGRLALPPSTEKEVIGPEFYRKLVIDEPGLGPGATRLQGLRGLPKGWSPRELTWLCVLHWAGLVKKAPEEKVSLVLNGGL